MEKCVMRKMLKQVESEQPPMPPGVKYNRCFFGIRIHEND